MRDSPHALALADLGGCYAAVAEMSIFPANRWNMLRLLLAAMVPFVPLALLAMSLDELAQQLFNILL